MTTIEAHHLNVAVWMEVGEILEGIILVGEEEADMVVGIAMGEDREGHTWGPQPTCPLPRWSRS